MGTLLMIFIFITVLLVFYSIYLLLFEQRVTIKNRLKQTGKSLDQYHEDQDKKQKGLLKGILQQAIRFAEGSNYYARIKTKLLQAYIKMKPIEFIEISIMAGLVSGYAVLDEFRQSFCCDVGACVGISGTGTAFGVDPKKTGKATE